MAIGVRPVTPADRDAVVALVPRLRAFGDAPLRSPDALDRAERETLERALQAAPDATDAEPDAVLLVAELEGLGVAGIAYVQTATDYFTQERHGHLAVDERGEGQGVGRALLAATERWCEARGHRFVTLNVFADNLRARAVYERAGFAPDTLRYYKELPSSVADEDRR